MLRTISLTVSPDTAVGYLYPDSLNGHGYSSFRIGNSLKWSITETGGADLVVEAPGYLSVRTRALLPAGSNELPWGIAGHEEAIPMDLQKPSISKIRIEGDSFYRGNKKFLVRGSTDFRLAKAEDGFVRIIEDRVGLGCNWFRLLSMKYNNTGYEFLPRASDHNDRVKKVFDEIGNVSAIGQYDIFADTAYLMSDEHEQLDYYHEQCELVQPYADFIVIGLCNEKSHGTQKFNNFNQFQPVPGLLMSHGSELTDQLPVTPFWNWSGYSARREGNFAKVASNYSPMTAFEQWPPVCMIPQEGLKPENYGFDTEVARQLGKNARVVTGGIFHHNAWMNSRVFNMEEATCALAFWNELQ